ncbi:MAG: hypothetical protein H6737_27205 [Alphaproteobacteria bacterium]|nr:hypothetical protein [Alphaproteobacteria bacterium]
MHPDLERLEAADHFDRELLALKKQKQDLESGLEAARTAAKAAKADLERLEGEDAANKARQRELQRDIERYEARLKSAERVLEGGGGDPEAAERQIAGCTEQLDLLETEALECMEKADALTDALANARRAVEETDATLARLAGAHEPAVAKLRAAFESTVPKRDAELAAVDAGTRSKYLALRDRKGSAVAKLELGACRSCRMVVQQQHLADLKRGLVVPCRGCGRWLIPEDG